MALCYLSPGRHPGRVGQAASTGQDTVPRRALEVLDGEEGGNQFHTLHPPRESGGVERGRPRSDEHQYIRNDYRTPTRVRDSR